MKHPLKKPHFARVGTRTSANQQLIVTQSMTAMNNSSSFDYAHNDLPLDGLLYFVLDEARGESPQKCAQLFRSAAHLTNAEAVQHECRELAGLIEDAHQAIDQHIALLMDGLSSDGVESEAIRFSFDRIRDQPISIKIALAEGISTVVTGDSARSKLATAKSFEADDLAGRFNSRLDALLFKLRSRYFDISNAAAGEALAAEEKRSPKVA